MMQGEGGLTMKQNNNNNNEKIKLKINIKIAFIPPNLLRVLTD